MSTSRWLGSAVMTVALVALLLVVLSPVAVLFRLQPVLRGVTSELNGDTSPRRAAGTVHTVAWQ